ncbi:MAG TPA: sterol desaturase family protein [Candidatus Angelobacter sp.]|nr:sterol desaturase family protein [Candidatus Angelobacter sp.]
MSNVKVFIALFVCVQVLFMSLDIMDLWVEKRNTGDRILRESRPVIVLVLISCAAYFLLQLLLAALMPGLPSLIRSSAVLTGTTAVSTRAISPSWLLLVLISAYSATTFFDYLVHRFLLHGLLWRLHENHHLPTVVSNLMPGIAARPFVAIPNLLINLCTGLFVLWLLRLTGHPQLLAALPTVVPALIVWFACIACASHSSFLRRFTFVDRLFRALMIITPREHLLHHAADLKGNYGNFTALWDRLFGTYIDPKLVPQPVLGLDYDQDFLGAISAGRLKLSGPFRRRYQVGRVCRIHEEES